MHDSGLLRPLAVLLTLASLGFTPAQDKGGFLPVKAVVIGTSDLASAQGVIATIQVQVTEEQRSSALDGFGKGDTIDLEITARTKIERRVGGQRTGAKLDGLVKGCKIEFRDYAEVLQSKPAIVSPGTVIITEPAR